MKKTFLFLACFAFCSSVSASPQPDIGPGIHESHFTNGLHIIDHQPTSAFVLEVCDYNVQAIDKMEFIVLLDPSNPSNTVLQSSDVLQSTGICGPVYRGPPLRRS